MDVIIQKLNMIVDDFLTDKIGADRFEIEYTQLYDFTDFDNDPPDYYQKVRGILERHTSDKSDLENFPEYYISDSMLFDFIVQLKERCSI